MFLIVLASGCASSQPVTVDANRGLSISSFAIDPSTAFSGELVLAELEVANVGGTTAQDVQVDLFGVENQWRDDTGDLVDSTLTRDLSDLKPPDATRNIPGDVRLVQYQLMTPDIRQGISPTMSIEARVTYDYSTNGFIDIPALSEDEYRRQQSLGQAVAAPPTVVNSAGPIHMTMDTRFSPIRVDTISDDDVQLVPLRITFANVGDGFPVTEEDSATIIGAGGKLEGTIELLGDGLPEFEDCLGETSGTLINLDSSQIALRLRQDGTFNLPCTIRIDMSSWNNRPVGSIKLLFDLDYRYYVAERASATVSGR